jgi:hypothetical protein
MDFRTVLDLMGDCEDTRSLQRWLVARAQSPRGMLSVLNFYCLLQYDTGLSDDDLEKIVRDLSAYLTARGTAPDASATADFVSVEIGRDREFLWRGRRWDPEAITLSRVVSYGSLAYDYERTLSMPIWSHDEGNKGLALSLLQKVHNEVGKPDSKLEFGGYNGVLWFARRAELRSRTGDGEDSAAIAAAARDVLGLDHLEDQYLIELVVENEISGPRWMPMILHADFSTVFTASDGPSGWGATLDLEDLSKGIAETVKQKGRWSRFDHRLLGTPGARKLHAEEEREKLAERFREELRRSMASRGATAIADYDAYLRWVGLAPR